MKFTVGNNYNLICNITPVNPLNIEGFISFTDLVM